MGCPNIVFPHFTNEGTNDDLTKCKCFNFGKSIYFTSGFELMCLQTRLFLNFPGKTYQLLENLDCDIR